MGGDFSSIFLGISLTCPNHNPWAQLKGEGASVEKVFICLIFFVTIVVLVLPLVVNGGKLMSLTSIWLTTIADSDLKQLVVLEKTFLIYHSQTQTQIKNCLSDVIFHLVWSVRTDDWMKKRFSLNFVCKFIHLIGLSVLSVFWLSTSLNQPDFCLSPCLAYSSPLRSTPQLTYSLGYIP